MGKIKLALSIMVLLFTVSACRNDSYGDNDDNTSTSSEIPVAESVTGTISATTETTAAKKPATFRETLESELDEKTNRLFTAFVNGDKETLAMLSGAKDISAFDFIDDIEFAGYEIEKSDVVEESDFDINHFGKAYTVILSVGRSSDSRFPVGESEWEISLLPRLDGTVFGSLSPIGEGVLKISDMALSENTRFCYALTVELEPYFGRFSRDGFALPGGDTTEFHGLLANFFGKIRFDDPIERTASGYNSAAKEIFGMDTDFTDENIDSAWRGAYEKEAVLVSESENEIVIDYYADSLLLTKAFTVKYTLDTANGIRLISVENLYDSGLQAASYST